MTIHSAEEACNRALVITDSNGNTCQHVIAQTFLIYDHEDQSETPYRRDEGWWDIRMTRQIDPQRIAFPAAITWDANNQ